MHYRHKTSKAVEQGSKPPSDEWERIDGPEKIDPADVPTPGVQDVPTPEAPGAKASKAEWVTYGAALGQSEVELAAMSKAELVKHLTT